MSGLTAVVAGSDRVHLYAAVRPFNGDDNASGITGINLPVDAGWLATASWHTYGGIRDKR